MRNGIFDRTAARNINTSRGIDAHLFAVAFIPSDRCIDDTLLFF